VSMTTSMTCIVRFFNSSEPFFNPFHRFHRHYAWSVDVVFLSKDRALV
jgi:hypothetical protein